MVGYGINTLACTRKLWRPACDGREAFNKIKERGFDMGKTKFSILGDSLSTFEGVSVPLDACFYSNWMKYESGIIAPSDTWWGRVIEQLSGVLLVNNSISGSTVFKHPACEIASYGCSDERTASLGRGGETPDVIMVFMGTNDWGYGIPPRYEAGKSGAPIFLDAYTDMIRRLKSNYPEAEIFCITPFVAACSRREAYSFPYTFGGRHIKEYCDVVCEVAERLGCIAVDLYSCKTEIDTVDGFHANKEGMKVIADCVLAELARDHAPE